MRRRWSCGRPSLLAHALPRFSSLSHSARSPDDAARLNPPTTNLLAVLPAYLLSHGRAPLSSSLALVSCSAVSALGGRRSRLFIRAAARQKRLFLFTPPGYEDDAPCSQGEGKGRCALRPAIHCHCRDPVGGHSAPLLSSSALLLCFPPLFFSFLFSPSPPPLFISWIQNLPPQDSLLYSHTSQLSAM